MGIRVGLEEFTEEAEELTDVLAAEGVECIETVGVELLEVVLLDDDAERLRIRFKELKIVHRQPAFHPRVHAHCLQIRLLSNGRQQIINL